MTANFEMPCISVVIPAYGRVEPLKYTLRSAAASARAAKVPAEIIVVDDGSEPPMEVQLAGFDAGYPVHLVRQANQGSIAARLTGYRVAQGRYIQFLDSDDLIHPDKLGAHLLAMEESGAEVSYSDAAEAALGADYGAAFGKAVTNLPVTDDAATLLLKIQPAPYSPVFRRTFLAKALEHSLLPIERVFDPSGDIWLYRTVALVPGKAVKVARPLAATGPHEEGRFSQCWEKLGVASLGIDEAFMRVTAGAASAERLRRLVAERAYASWRLLPYDAPREFDRRCVSLWQAVPGAAARRSRRLFGIVDAVLGPELSGRVYRRLRRPSYDQCKTLTGKREFAELVAKLPEIS